MSKFRVGDLIVSITSRKKRPAIYKIIDISPHGYMTFSRINGDGDGFWHENNYRLATEKEIEASIKFTDII